MKLFIIFFISFNSYSQIKDTVYIKFNEAYEEMEKVQFSVSEDALPSYSYLIKQKEKAYLYDNKFRFGHYNRSPELIKKFYGGTPKVFKQPTSFLDNKKVLDIKFFRTTSYITIAKTFEKEDTWEQNVVIFMVDANEKENDSIVLREVKFSRPVKE